MKDTKTVRTTYNQFLTENEARVLLRKLYDFSKDGYKHRSWVRVESMTGINRTTACRIATTNYFPKDPGIRKLLGVASVGEAPICSTCGVVHVKRCPHTSRSKHRDWFAYPVNELNTLIEQALEDLRR